jgi:hypothetical protein
MSKWVRMMRGDDEKEGDRTLRLSLSSRTRARSSLSSSNSSLARSRSTFMVSNASPASLIRC